VEGDDRVSGTDADRGENISHNGSSGFGGNADSTEAANLGPFSAPIAATATVSPSLLRRSLSQLALLMLQKLSHGAELVCKGEQGSPCVEFLNVESMRHSRRALPQTARQ
jgi:hypothetical protein